MALGLAKDQHAELIALHVVAEIRLARGTAGAEYGPPSYFEAAPEDLLKSRRKTPAKEEATMAKSGHSAKTVLVETLGQSVAQAILARARKLGADLILMGTHGRGGLSGLVMGSDAEGRIGSANFGGVSMGSRPRC